VVEIDLSGQAGVGDEVSESVKLVPRTNASDVTPMQVAIPMLREGSVRTAISLPVI